MSDQREALKHGGVWKCVVVCGSAWWCVVVRGGVSFSNGVSPWV